MTKVATFMYTAIGLQRHRLNFYRRRDNFLAVVFREKRGYILPVDLLEGSIRGTVLSKMWFPMGNGSRSRVVKVGDSS